MSLIDDIRKDREAGTPGPWFDMPMQGPRAQTNFARVYATDDDLRCIADCRDTMNFHSVTDNQTNARRIARVPDLEAALLAADQYINMVSAYLDEPNACDPFVWRKKLTDALAAYRAAIGESQ